MDTCYRSSDRVNTFGSLKWWNTAACEGTMTSLGGVFCLSSLYVAGLLGCILAGVTSPDIFIEKSTRALNATSKASTTYVFDATDYQVLPALMSSEEYVEIRLL